MRKTLTGGLAAIALTLAACGGGGGAQDEVADLLIESADEQDLGLDEDCVRDLTSQLSDDDAQAIVDAGVDGDPGDISEEAEQLGDDLQNCIDITSIVEQLAAEDDSLDADCILEGLEDVPSEEQVDALFALALGCTTGG